RRPSGRLLQSGSSSRPGLRVVRVVVSTDREVPARGSRHGESQTFAFSATMTAMTNPPGSPPLRRYFRHGTLPQLAAFEATVRLGSASRAAQALCIAQPTISGHLRKLGEALDVSLF